MMKKLMVNCVGLALGGGGARGLAHIGVLKVLEEEKIPVGVIAGTSMGALVGAAYASGLGAGELEQKVAEYLNTPEFQSSVIRAMERANEKGDVNFAKRIHNFFTNTFYLVQAMFRPGILSAEEFQVMIDYFVPDIQIEDTRIPWHGVAADLVSGEEIVLSKGSLRRAVMASCAVPGAIEPLKDGARLLADGGIVSMVPTRVARRQGADTVIAVVVEKDISLQEELLTAKEISDRANEVMSNRLVHYDLQAADIVICPEVAALEWADFSHALNLIDAGAKATREHLPEIRQSISGLKSWFSARKLLRNFLPE
ncbi:MAG: patatin-like phospholipase family protein [Syntrophobacterales bacterium]|nr:patatin-like phospholipase family protein [Syntrophobacterales bacterium]